MKFKNEIKHIVLSGVLLGLAIIIGVFAHFPLFGGTVYLIGAIVFVLPLVLPFGYAIITGVIAVALSDVFSGWAAYCWISIIAYGLAITIIWLFTRINLKITFLIGMVFAALEILVAYFFLEWIVFDKALAFSDLAATAIEMIIVIPIASMLYFPLRLVGKK